MNTTKTLKLMTTALRVLTKYCSNQFSVQHKQQELSNYFSGTNREDFSPHGTTKNVTSRKRRKTKCIEDLDHQQLKIGLQPLRFIRKLIITIVESVNKKKISHKEAQMSKFFNVTNPTDFWKTIKEVCRTPFCQCILQLHKNNVFIFECFCWFRWVFYCFGSRIHRNDRT